MILTMNNKAYEAHFGIRFIRELDKNNFLEREGVKFGAGLELKVPLLFSYDAVALSDVLYTGMCTEKNRPSQAAVDDFIENHEDLEGLFGEVISELKKGSVTSLKLQRLEENMKGQK